MKSFKFLFLFIVAITAIVSCKKDDSPDLILDEVKMTSFGFYESDNPGIILEDYVVTDIRSNEINILLPEDVEKSNLVARYTVSNGNTVKVNNVLQKSGESANDFSIPLDYILMANNNNARYVVTVGKRPAYIWKAMAAVYEEPVSNSVLAMHINPISGLPYVMYKDDKTSAEQRVFMAYYDGSIWKSLGAISDGRAGSYVDFSFNANGEPYAAYSDYTATVSQTATVKKYQGTGWEVVGNKGFTSAVVTYTAMAFTNNDQLFVFNMFDGRTGPLSRRELVISNFNGNTWTTDLTMPGRASTTFTYNPVAVRKNNIVYLATFNPITPNSISLYKYENNVWTTLLDNWYDPKATGINTRDLAMDVDQNGNVYIAFADNSNDAVFKNRVIKYDHETKSVTNVGSHLSATSGNLFNFDLAVSPLGTPYMFYRNQNGYPSISYLDKETKEWTTPQVLESQSVDELNIDFAPDGKAYATYIKNKRLVAYEYVAP